MRKSTTKRAIKSTTTARQQTAQDTEQQLRASIGIATEQLLTEIQAGMSERLTGLLAFASRFHQYSLGNQLLIQIQCADATFVAGYKTWERMGYHVAKGQKGIRILAPRPYMREARKDERGNEDGKVSGVAFASVAVFDASQLNPDDVAAKPLPQFYTNMGSDEDTEALYTRMVKRMQAQGITVEERDDLTGDKQGYSAGGYVAIRKGLASRNRIRTLAHEWAHELLHQSSSDAKQLAKTVKECHAEATSFIVLAHFGVHNDLSSDYLQMWGNTAETLTAELGMVQKAASAIITALEASEDATASQVA